ncbi:MAG: hypothetical protein BGN88_06795 [Clostridiales bacterium 43-6]|nr:MAG: hypothetical protein BGN88_06795 [Clostridiales bacterium 43-6]
MGTYVAEKYNIMFCEFENLHNPERILDIHKEYIAAGAKAIKTNTFSANTFTLKTDFDTVKSIIDSGCSLAKQAVSGTDTLIFASIGPIRDKDSELTIPEQKKIIDVFFDNHINTFIFETFSEYETLITLSRYIKEKDKDSYIIAECTVNADRYTSRGISVSEIIKALDKTDEIDACGFNCTCGPLHLLEIAKELPKISKPVSIMPNAGYPTFIGGRSFYKSSPIYFGEKLSEIHSCGVQILGGCCGTGPDYIKQATKALEATENSEKTETVTITVKEKTAKPKTKKKNLIAVELDSPLDTNAEYFYEGAKILSRAGADFITIADCPLSRARMDSSMLSAKLKRDFNIDAIPHLTCRDRNINATKALLLALYAEGIHEILAVTGDAIPSADRNEIKGVYNFNSVMLASFIGNLNETIFSENPFTISCALNINQNNFEAELKKAKRKEEAGCSRFLTQPVYTDASLENLALAKQVLKSPVLAGLMPVVSYKNALFINSEVPGITIPDAIIKAMEHADREKAAQIAVESILAISEKIKGLCDGYYLITPLKRVDIIETIIKGL